MKQSDEDAEDCDLKHFTFKALKKVISCFFKNIEVEKITIYVLKNDQLIEIQTDIDVFNLKQDDLIVLQTPEEKNKSVKTEEISQKKEILENSLLTKIEPEIEFTQIENEEEGLINFEEIPVEPIEGNIEKMINKGLKNEEEGNLDEAEKIFLNILQIFPDDELNLTHLSKLYIKKKNFNESIIIQTKAINRLKDEENEKKIKFLTQRALTFMTIKAFEKASNDFVQAISMMERLHYFKNKEKQDLHLNFLNLGKTYKFMKKFKQAISCFSAALYFISKKKSNFDNEKLKIKILLKRAKCFDKEKNYVEGLLDYEKCKKIIETLQQDVDAMNKLNKRLEEIELSIKVLNLQLAKNVENKIKLICPFSQRRYYNPYYLVDSGNTYSKVSLKDYLFGKNTDPISGEVLRFKLIVPNENMHYLIKKEKKEIIIYIKASTEKDIDAEDFLLKIFTINELKKLILSKWEERIIEGIYLSQNEQKKKIENDNDCKKLQPDDMIIVEFFKNELTTSETPEEESPTKKKENLTKKSPKQLTKKKSFKSDTSKKRKTLKRGSFISKLFGKKKKTEKIIVYSKIELSPVQNFSFFDESTQFITDERMCKIVYEWIQHNNFSKKLNPFSTNWKSCFNIKTKELQIKNLVLLLKKRKFIDFIQAIYKKKEVIIKFYKPKSITKYANPNLKFIFQFLSIIQKIDHKNICKYFGAVWTTRNAGFVTSNIFLFFYKF